MFIRPFFWYNQHGYACICAAAAMLRRRREWGRGGRMNGRKVFKNCLLTVGILSAAAFLSLIMLRPFNSGMASQTLDSNMNGASLIFVLAVLLISRLTDGYIYGVAAAVFSVFAVNYAFTYPFFAFNFTLSGYLLTFLTMLTVAMIVSVLTTKIKRQEQVRLEAEKEKLRANLLRAVSHDLRTPLTSILGSTGAMMDNELPREKQLELLKAAHQDAQWLLRMVENLLAITRIGEGSAPLTLETEVVEDVISEAVTKFRKHFPSIAVRTVPCEDIMMADMDAVLIEQVLQNIMENAVYHGHTTTEITISTRHDGSIVTLSVKDNGCGIRKDILPRIFSGTLGSSQHGTDQKRNMGIGLSVCYSIISAHGGIMTAENAKPGGAVFTFTLPEKEIQDGSESIDY